MTGALAAVAAGRNEISEASHLVLDKLDRCRAGWGVRARGDLVTDLALFARRAGDSGGDSGVAEPTRADLVHGAALAIFLLEGL